MMPRLRCMLTVLQLVLIHGSAFQMPEDVEMLQGYEAPGPILIAKKPEPDAETTNAEEIVQAMRNRRALIYHITSLPSFNKQESSLLHSNKNNPKFILKRDVNALDVDVSAQYMEQLAFSRTHPRSKREVIEEENPIRRADQIDITEAPEVKQWIPQPSTNEDDINTVPSKTDEVKSPSMLPNPESLQDKQQIGREARGLVKDQWIKMPYVSRPVENDQLSSAGSNLDESNHRMPRVNFVTQGKNLQASESRNQRDSLPRSGYRSDLRTDFYTPSSSSRENRGRSIDYAPYSRQNYYYPDEYSRRRGSYDDLGYYDDLYYNQRPDPYDAYDYKNSRRSESIDYSRNRMPYNRDDGYDADYERYNRPRRIIYYATLPDVSRSPPSVYRYSNPSPHSRYDDDRYYRDTRYDGRRRGTYYPSNRYPYSALKKSETEDSKDISSSTKAITAEIIKRQQDLHKKDSEDAARARESKMNSHQYPISLSTNTEGNGKTPHQTLYHDVTRLDGDYNRYDHPSFQAAVDDPYVNRHD